MCRRVSVDQWAYQFKLWSTVKDEQITRFTSENKERFRTNQASVCVTTYNMVAFGGRRSEESEEIINQIKSREWGLLLMDEVRILNSDYCCRCLKRSLIRIEKPESKLAMMIRFPNTDSQNADCQDVLTALYF
jgi:DNA excision repair protein ERCC-3